MTTTKLPAGLSGTSTLVAWSWLHGVGDIPCHVSWGRSGTVCSPLGLLLLLVIVLHGLIATTQPPAWWSPVDDFVTRAPTPTSDTLRWQRTSSSASSAAAARSGHPHPASAPNSTSASAAALTPRPTLTASSCTCGRPIVRQSCTKPWLGFAGAGIDRRQRPWCRLLSRPAHDPTNHRSARGWFALRRPKVLEVARDPEPSPPARRGWRRATPCPAGACWHPQLPAP